MPDKKQRPVPQDWDENEWGNQGSNEHFSWSTQKLASAYQKHIKGEAWHKSSGQQNALKKRRKLEKTKEYQDKKKKVAQQTASDPKWKEQHNKQLNRMNTDPEILANRYEANKVTWVSVTSPQGVFDKVGDFAEATGMSFNDKKRLLPHLYYITNEGPGEAKTEKVYYTPSGYFPSMAMAQEADGREWENYEQLSFKPHIKWFKGMMKKYPEEYYVKVEPKRDWILVIGKPAK